MIEDKKNDVKIYSEEESFWKDVKEKTENEIKTLEKMLKFNKAIFDLAEERFNLACLESEMEDHNDTD